MNQAAYVLYSTTICQNQVEVGNYLILPKTVITDTNQKSKRKEMLSKEEPPGHLPQHAECPPKNIQESHRSHIPFRRDD